MSKPNRPNHNPQWMYLSCEELTKQMLAQMDQESDAMRELLLQIPQQPDEPDEIVEADIKYEREEEERLRPLFEQMEQESEALFNQLTF